MSRRQRLTLALVGAVAVSAGAVVAVLAFLGPFELDAREVERDVAAQYEEQQGVGLDLACPDDMPVESGGVFPCRGTTDTGESVYVEIQIADPEDAADYHWWVSA